MTGPAPSEAAIEAARRHAGNYRIIGSSIEAIVRAAYAVDFPSSGEAPALPDVAELIDEHRALLEENIRLRGELAATWLALEEMRWPDLPGIPYFVHLDGETRPMQIEAQKVVGIFAALRKHAKDLMPTGVEAARAWYAEAGVHATIAKRDAEIAALRDELSPRDLLRAAFVEGALWRSGQKSMSGDSLMKEADLRYGPPVSEAARLASPPQEERSV
jgi:hypothetical protein